MSDETYQRVAKIFSSVLTDEQFSGFSAEATMDEVDGWDSLSFLEIIMAMESEFDIRIDGLDAAELISLPNILAYLKKQS